MSFILDALKKSESDRQRQSGPSLFEVKVAPPRRRLPIWAVAIALLLAINVVVISWMLLRHPTEPAPTAAAAAGAAAAPAPAATATAPARPPVAVPAPTGATSADRSLPPPSGATAATSTSAPATTVSSTPSASAAALASHPDASDSEQSAADSPVVIAPNDYAPAVEPKGAQHSGAAGTTDDLPLYQQVVSSDGLPSLHLDLHVFAQHPQDRFVMINMHRLQEGDTLPSGVQVESIRPDGVVLSYHGTRFLLPRN